MASLELKDALAAEYLRLKARARLAIYEAVRDGRVLRSRSCSECLKYCKPDAHHHKGYARENWLNVKWLCEKCHAAQDEAE